VRLRVSWSWPKYFSSTALAIVAGFVLQACAGAGGGDSGQPPMNIAGNWTGASFPGCRSQGGEHCYHRPISFVLTQNGDRVSGSYSCPVGNMMCGTDNTGNVENGKMEGSYLRDLRVTFSDATNCMYQGQFTADSGNGEYMCFVGGGRIAEQGGWHLDRAQ